MAKLNQVEKVQVPSIGALPVRSVGSVFKASGVVRKFQAAVGISDGGFTTENQPAELNLQLNASSKLDLSQLNSVENETITVSLSNNSVYTMPNAWCSEPAELRQGVIVVQFQSNRSDKIQ